MFQFFVKAKTIDSELILNNSCNVYLQGRGAYYLKYLINVALRLLILANFLHAYALRLLISTICFRAYVYLIRNFLKLRKLMQLTSILASIVL